MKAVWVLVIIYGQDAVFDGDAFAGEGDDALDDVLVADAFWGCAGDDAVVFAVSKYDDLSALRDVFLAEKMSDRDRDAIDDNAVIGV